jgi:hypothetical protein
MLIKQGRQGGEPTMDAMPQIAIIRYLAIRSAAFVTLTTAATVLLALPYLG